MLVKCISKISPQQGLHATGVVGNSMACKHALEAAEHFGISQVELETDSSQLREAFTSDQRSLHWWWPLH